MGRRAMTDDEKKEAIKRRALQTKEWKIKNCEKFKAYMSEYYLENKKIINDRSHANAKLRKLRQIEEAEKK
jgi:hypothetical protein